MNPSVRIVQLIIVRRKRVCYRMMSRRRSVVI